MLAQATNFGRLYCTRCDLTFGDEQPDEKGNVCCPQCNDVIKGENCNIVRISKEKCRCASCGTQFGAISTEATPAKCPACGNLEENRHAEVCLGSKSRPSWQSSTDDTKIRAQIQAFADQNICYGKDKIVGFPGTIPEPIAVEVYNQYLDRHPNNIGMHTNKDMCDCEIGFGGTQAAEREVIAMAADLMNADPQEVDGYIASGGTEANLVGCWMGRDAHRQKPCAIICSYLTHYSVIKASNVLGIGIEAGADGNGLHLLGTDDTGHLLLDQFEQKLRELADKGISNIIVVGNAGTTMLGSVDNIPAMNDIVEETKAQYPETNIHFHVDAAFGGFVIPFIDWLPEIGFSNKRVDSITIDVHKMGLAPYGSGIILARRGLFQRVKSIAPYIPGNDCTLCGSRSGTIALSCWAAMKKIGKEGYEHFADRLTSMAHGIRLRLESAGFQTFHNDINIVAVKGEIPEALRNIYITHVHEGFPADLSNPLNSEKSTVWNIVVMNHTTMELIDELVAKLKG
ncbi:MAG: pyridoxal-dependent decarboxylase [Parcubacteria group bacterium]|jgi:glutamate/tyrosine decarboxylase-like PLP-dependent enzyme